VAALRELATARADLLAEVRGVLEVVLHEGTHALAVVRGIRDTSAAGNR